MVGGNARKTVEAGGLGECCVSLGGTRGYGKEYQQPLASLVSGNHPKFSISNSNNLDQADNNLSD
jgi:hypothetical protein